MVGQFRHFRIIKSEREREKRGERERVQWRETERRERTVGESVFSVNI